MVWLLPCCSCARHMLHQLATCILFQPLPAVLKTPGFLHEGVWSRVRAHWTYESMTAGSIHLLDSGRA